MNAVDSRVVAGDWDLAGGQAKVYSGHESFPCRYGWVPKLYEAVLHDGELFRNDESAVLTLGMGKNMVKAIRFWGQVFGLLHLKRGHAHNTEFARRLLDIDYGIDPYLENPSSMCRLHWNVTTHAGLAAWVTIFLELQDSMITRDRLIDVIVNRAKTSKRSITQRTATSHVDIFLRTYDWSLYDSTVSGEDALGCPLQELQLIETMSVNGQIQVNVKRGPKPQLDVGAFAFALRDYWQGTAPHSRSLPLRDLTIGRRSPGVVFRLDESSLFVCVEQLCAISDMQIRNDGVGGTELFSGERSLERLEEIAWPKS